MQVEFLSATPILASLDIERSTQFFASKLGFTVIHAVQGQYGIVANGTVHIHFWACNERSIAAATSCRVHVQGVEKLFESCRSLGIVHPNAPLQLKPWGSHEFAILDTDGNLVTFYGAAAT